MTLKEANNIIWDNKLNSLPIVDEEGKLVYMVFRKDYDSHKENPLELQDSLKRYVVGAGINTRDYAERVPALLEAGVDILCIDSSEGHSEWQATTIAWIREPPPIPIFIKSAPASAKNLKPSLSTTLPAPILTLSPYVSLKDNVGLTLSKVRSTMCNCGALSIAELQKKAKLTVVSATSIVEGGAHDVLLKDNRNL